jgi:hypothetical protein
VINAFLSNPSKNALEHTLCRQIRDHQDLLPRAATTTRRLALSVLTTNRANTFCLYHHSTQKAGLIVDGQGKYKHNGVPYPRLVAKTKKEVVLPRDGYMHCGCKEDVALADFCFWKTWKLTCSETGTAVTESLKDHKFAPCERAFIAAFFNDVTELTINDLYSGKKDPRVHRKALLRLQANRLVEKLKKMEEEDGDEAESEMEV